MIHCNRVSLTVLLKWKALTHGNDKKQHIRKKCEPLIEKIDLPFSDAPGENQAPILANSFKSFKDCSRKVQMDELFK